MKSLFKLLSSLSLILIFSSCQNEEMNPLQKIMQSDSKAIKNIADQLEAHEVQILYTQIERDAEGKPLFQEFDFQLDDSQYFYPASTAKMPVAILTLQKLNELKSQGEIVNAQSAFKMYENGSRDIIIDSDSTAQTGLPSIEHMIKKIFLVSDNDAYNYLFDFLGRDYVNQELKKRGMGPAHINHKFLYGADNKNTAEFEFFNDSNEPIYQQASIASKVDRHELPLKGMIKGVGYTDNEGKLYNEPFDFSEKNYFSLESLNKILKAVIFPESLPENERFNLTEEQYEFLRFWMSRNTLESDYPNYKNGDYYESYVKFFMFGDSKDPMPDHIRIFNKVGDAYGTLTDVAYIKDSKNNIEFMLAATVHVNKNEIFNDGIYEYDELAFPFLAELGRQVYAHELDSKK